MDPARVPDWAKRPSARRPTATRAGQAMPRIVLVGPCASGKSTLAVALRADGHDIRVCAQEHSEVPHLWALLEPDLMLFLDVDLEAIRRRRGNPRWSAAVFREQQRRLRQARERCAVYIDTSARTAAEVVMAARAGLRAAGVSPVKETG